MEVILREEVENLGRRGDVVKVAAGYARNYLLPKKLAVAATASNKTIVEQERQAWLRKEAVLKNEAAELATLMSGVVVSIVQKAGEHDQLFGSVTAKDIAEDLTRQNYKIDRRKILLPEPIKTLGEHKVEVKLHRDVTAVILVRVEKEGGEDAAAPEADAAPPEAEIAG